MADQPFKCVVHFPDPGSPRDEDDVRNSFEIIDKCEAETRTPVVILLGWAGCQEKHLAKYSPMYEKKGFITLQVIVPSKTLFFRSNKVVDVAHGLVNLLNKHGIANNPIILHVFSNGGTMVYSHLATFLNSPESDHHQALSVRGVIFDSAPGKSRIMNAVRAFMGTVGGSWILQYILGFCLLLYMIITRYLLTLLPLGLKAGKGFQLYDSICEDATMCPQLFLYSKADKVVMAEDIEEVITRRKAAGVKVQSVCWEDTAHVAHFRTHPEVYTKACLDFVSGCLDFYNNGNKEGIAAL